MSQVTLSESRTYHRSIWQRMFLWLAKFLPTTWLTEELKRRHGIYLIVLMNPDAGRTIVGGKHDGTFEIDGTLTYCISPMLLEGVFDELDKRMEVDRIIMATNNDKVT